MSTAGSVQAARNLRVAFDLHRAGVSLMTARLRRLHPEATPEEIRDRLRTWLLTRPGAEWGDGEGRRRTL